MNEQAEQEQAADEFAGVKIDGDNIHQRIARAMLKVSYIQKQKGGGLQYSVVTHDAVTAKVRPALLAEGVIYYPKDMEHHQNGNRTEVFLKVVFVNIDNPKDFIEVPAIGYGIDAQDKGPGKAVSYAVKYALLKALGLETGDDPDLDQKTEHAPEKKKIEAADWVPAEFRNNDGTVSLTKARDWESAFYKDLHSCSDMDEYQALVNSNKPGINVIQTYLPGNWHGDDGDIAGLKKTMAQVVEQLKHPQAAE